MQIVDCWHGELLGGGSSSRVAASSVHALGAASNPDGGAESVPPSLTVPNWWCQPLGNELLDTIRARSEEADVGSSEEAQ